MSLLPPTVLRWQAGDLLGLTAEDVALHTEGASLLPGCPLGVITSAPITVTPACSEVIVSWEGRAGPGATLEIELRASSDTIEPLLWTRWWTMAVWSEDGALRHSVAGQTDETGTVETDTLILHQPAVRLQWRVTLRRGSDDQSPLLRGLTLATSPFPEMNEGRLVAVPALPVPELSQMVYPDGGPVWCSPTALTMVLGYWALLTQDPALHPFVEPAAVPEATSPGVYDPVYGGTGNWPFNTAYAASLGLEAYVGRLPTIAALSDWLAAGVPVITSIRWQPGTLDQAPIAHSNGHLVVVVGLTPAGDVIVNDPAADPRAQAPIHRVYRHTQFRRAWLGGSGGAAYLIYPPGWLAGVDTLKGGHGHG